MKRSRIITGVELASEEYGEPLSHEEYQQWREDQSKEYPTKMQLLRQFDVLNWVSLCETLGVKGIERPTNAYYSVRDMKSAMFDAVDAVGEPFSESAYRSHHPKNDVSHEGAPSVGIIKDVIGDGSWKTACRRLDITPTSGSTDNHGYDKELVKTAVRQAEAACDGKLTEEKYRNWRETADEKKPSVGLVYRYLVDWDDICLAAGVG